MVYSLEREKEKSNATRNIVMELKFKNDIFFGPVWEVIRTIRWENAMYRDRTKLILSSLFSINPISHVTACAP